ncbi:MAG TPA: tetratricopeptide repeat protein [Verrucomicrobiae bacterium]|nr:tetratricopeptide repeat protein [Verrucomicrobiae bacterium]
MRELYEKGNAALQKKNFDYAIAIYNQVLNTEPGFYPCREALRSCQLSKAGSGGGFFKKVFGTASASPQMAKAQFQVRNSPVEALTTCEQILNADPNNATAHRILAEAAMALEFPKTAVLSLEIASRNNPRDIDAALKLGEALNASGQIQRAQTIYTELQKANPNNPAIAQALKNLAARRTLRDGGYEAMEASGGSYRDILKDKAEAKTLEQENRQVKSEDVAGELIREYQARLEKEPNDRRLLRSIAELYAQRKEFETALEYYAQMKTIEGQADPALDKAIAALKIRRFENKVTQLDATSPEYESQKAAVEKERVEFQIAEARRLVEAYPNDLAHRFDLGVTLYNAGRISEAIQEFQKAQHNPHKKIQSLYYLGQSFAKRNMLDLAARSLQNALAEKQGFDEEKKELIYVLGSVLEKQGKPEQAIEQFKQIYEVDIGFKDVAAKVDAYYAGTG